MERGKYGMFYNAVMVNFWGLQTQQVSDTDCPVVWIGTAVKHRTDRKARNEKVKASYRLNKKGDTNV